MPELTTTQQRRLKNLEHQINRGVGDIYEALRAIHDEKLYLAEHSTFEDYCRERWGMTDRYARMLLHHGHVLRLVDDAEKPPENGSKPTEKQQTGTIVPNLKPAHTREVSDLPDNQKVEVLTEAVKTAPKENGKPKVTAQHVRETRERTVPTESIITDSLKRTVPKYLHAKHDAAAAIQSAASKLDAIKRTVVELAGGEGGEFIQASEIEQMVKELKGKISQSRYFTDCPKCKGRSSDKCKRCGGAKFIPFRMRGMLSAEEKAWLGIE